MKRLLFILLWFNSALHAQNATDQGTIWLGGIAGYSSSSSKNAKSTTITISPNARYFLKENIFVGSEIGWRRQKDGGSTISTLAIGPMAGIAFPDEKAIAIPYVAAGVGYLLNRLDDGIAILSRNGYEFSVSGGLNIQLKEALGLTAEVSYGIQTFNNGINFNVLTLGFGVTGIIN